MPIRNLAQRKSQIVAFASGLMVLLVIGGGLFRENQTATALTEAQARATEDNAARMALATADEATWQAFATYAPDKATQRAMQQLTVTFLPTPTWFDGPATGQALDKMLTTSPTPGPTEPPMTFIQRPAGAGRLVISASKTCGYNLKCIPENFWVEKTKDKFITVYAGRYLYPNGSAEAQLSVEWQPLSDPDALPIGGGVFPVPIPAQDVMIVDAIGEQLTLRTDDGTLLVFDVPSEQYISVPPSQLMARSQRPVGAGTLFENSDVPFALPGFSAAHRWSSKNAKGQITVWAGGSDKDFFLGKGKLAVVTSKGPPTAADMPQVYSPSGTVYGALWIFDVKGNLVVLRDRLDDTFVFDLAAQQFVSVEEAWPKLLTASLFDPNMPISQATPAPVTPFIPPTPVSTPVLNAYP